jgi:hypothetical protein
MARHPYPVADFDRFLHAPLSTFLWRVSSGLRLRRPILIRFKEWWREAFPDCNEAIASSAIKPSARRALPSTMAAMSKSLARSNKSGSVAAAT